MPVVSYIRHLSEISDLHECSTVFRVIVISKFRNVLWFRKEKEIKKKKIRDNVRKEGRKALCRLVPRMQRHVQRGSNDMPILNSP